jgi:predicted RNA-binding Zn ribbon-like protein
VTYGPQRATGPGGGGWRSVAALAATEILLARQRGQWARFKTCPFPVCGVAFYDESRNSSRVWHDVRTCGNQANLRAYRDRRKNPARPPA